MSAVNLIRNTGGYMTVTQNRELLRQQADEEKADQLWEQIFEDDSKICDFLTKDITGV